MEIPRFTGSCVYIIWNNDNDRFYIGSAKNYRRRIQLHLRKLNLGKHHSWKLQKDWKRFSNWETFSLIICDPADLIINEQWCLDMQKPYYNVCQTAGNTLGYKMSKVGIEKIRKYNLCRPTTHNLNISRGMKQNIEFISNLKTRCQALGISSRIGVAVSYVGSSKKEYYESIKEASVKLGILKENIQGRLSGRVKNQVYKNKYTFEKWDKKS